MRRADPPSPTPPRPSVTRPAQLEAAAKLAARRAKLRAEQRAQADADDAALDAEASLQAPVELRLAIGRDGLGIELAHPTALACLAVVELVVRLPSVKFPFDVSGGITRFRHKRGELERVALELDGRRFARWAETRLRGLVSAGPCTVLLAARAFGATLTVHGRSAVSQAAPRGELPALAFEVSLVPAHGDLTLAVHGARGAHLAEPATVLALRAVEAMLGTSARREGARFVVPDAGGLVARALLPEAGVRAPGTDDVRLAGSGAGDGVLFAAFVRGGSAAKAPAEATLAAETALLTRDADDARVRGDLDLARQLDLVALERAPRHPEIARRIAEIDRHVGGRADAANATLRDVTVPAHLGLLAGDLLADAGDPVAAVAALLRSGEHDPADVVAALAYGRAAALAASPNDALAWLDAGIARAPRLAELRWERARRRLEAGRLADARVDFQELEALARGARDRHDVLRRAGDVYRTAGLGGDAAILYERALLYRPDDPAALAGLGASLAAEGRAARGAAVLAHAIELAEARGLPVAWMLLELGRVLGERLGDRPAAVARLRDVTDDAPEAIDARGLEGRLRAQLGDPAGASLAFARLRERAGHERRALPWLVEAATFETERGALEAAQRHLAAAVGIAPDDADLAARYRALGLRIARGTGIRTSTDAQADAWRRDYEERPVTIEEREPPPSSGRVLPPIESESLDDGPTIALNGPLEPEPSLEPNALAGALGDLGGLEVDGAEAEAEARIESLTRTLQGDPTNDTVVDELVTLLSRLGRGMELLALLSARLEDAPADRREALLPKHREVLATLEREARAAGREMEADLFRMSRESTDAPGD